MAARQGSALPQMGPLLDSANQFMPQWSQWFTLTDRLATSIQQSGVTADRPTANLWVGRQFYDITLNKPVYVSAVNPTVWRDAAGAIV